MYLRRDAFTFVEVLISVIVSVSLPRVCSGSWSPALGRVEYATFLQDKRSSRIAACFHVADRSDDRPELLV